jgi:hypothetical protein
VSGSSIFAHRRGAATATYACVQNLQGDNSSGTGGRSIGHNISDLNSLAERGNGLYIPDCSTQHLAAMPVLLGTGRGQRPDEWAASAPTMLFQVRAFVKPMC